MLDVEKKNSDKIHVYVVLFFCVAFVLDTFFLKSRWFDFSFLTFSLLITAFLTLLHFKQQDKVFTIIFGILFVVYGFIMIMT